MAEYSKLAQGSFACIASQQVIYLPFVPNYVLVQNISGTNHAAGAGSVNVLQWTDAMNQGDGILQLQDSTGASHFSNCTAAGSPGITTFSAGLAFSYGAQVQIASISKANPAVVTTASAHGYSNGNIVFLEGVSGMQQIASIPFQITYISTTSFSIPWNTNQSNYTAVSGSPSGAYVRKINNPFLYAPGVSFISSITLGATTTVVTTGPNNFVVGQEVAFRIPPVWGSIQLNSLPNVNLPGSPIYGYVTSVTTSTNTVVVNINSAAFSAFNSNPAYAAGLTPPQILAVGDVNSGGWPYTGSQLYPSPIINGANTINGPAVMGAFVNNTRMGFVIGGAILTPGEIGNSSYFWQAMAFDYISNQSVGIAVN